MDAPDPASLELARPDVAEGGADDERMRADRDRADDHVRGRVDPRDRAVAVVRNPLEPVGAADTVGGCRCRPGSWRPPCSSAGRSATRSRRRRQRPRRRRRARRCTTRFRGRYARSSRRLSPDRCDRRRRCPGRRPRSSPLPPGCTSGCRPSRSSSPPFALFGSMRETVPAPKFGRPDRAEADRHVPRLLADPDLLRHAQPRRIDPGDRALTVVLHPERAGARDDAARPAADRGVFTVRFAAGSIRAIVPEP